MNVDNQLELTINKSIEATNKDRDIVNDDNHDSCWEYESMKMNTEKTTNTKTRMNETTRGDTSNVKSWRGTPKNREDEEHKKMKKIRTNKNLLLKRVESEQDGWLHKS